MDLEILPSDPKDFVGSGLPRTPNAPGNMHVTFVLRDMFERLHGGYGKGFSKKGLAAAAECGFTWEEVLEEIFSRKYADRMNQHPVRLTEVKKDGIVGSPDGVGPDPHDERVMVVYEYKFTWRSMRKTPLDIWMYEAQSKCYCAMLGTNVVIFDVLYCCGNYADIREPQRIIYRIEYMPIELRQFWEQVVEHAQFLEEKL